MLGLINQVGSGQKTIGRESSKLLDVLYSVLFLHNNRICSQIHDHPQFSSFPCSLIWPKLQVEVDIYNIHIVGICVLTFWPENKCVVWKEHITELVKFFVFMGVSVQFYFSDQE